MWCIEDIGVWFDQILGCAACCRSPVVFSYLIRTARERARAGDNALSCVDHDHIMTMFFIRMGVEDEVMEWVLEHCPETGAIRAEKLVRVVSYPVRPWRVMRKMLQYRPALCLPMLKLPLWAVQFGNVADLEHLAALNRPKLFTKKVLKHILQFSRDEAIMSWFLSRLKLDRVDLRVVRWAAKYGSIPILSSLFEDMITNEATRDDSVPLVQFFNTAIWGAIRHDQLNVLDWVGCQEDTGQNRNRLWTFSLANTAAQRGRLAIIRWLLKRGKVSIDQIKELIEIAARHGQIQCLQGLTSLIPRPEDA